MGPPRLMNVAFEFISFEIRHIAVFGSRMPAPRVQIQNMDSPYNRIMISTSTPRDRSVIDGNAFIII